MAWYWWILIGVGCLAIYALKVFLLKKWQKNAKMKQEQQDQELGDD